MKKTYCILLLAAAVFAGCNRDEKSLFDKSAAERAVEAVTNAQEALVAAPYGWEMLYFANTESRGYHMLLKFQKNGGVAITAKNDLTTGNKIVTDNESVWEVVSDYGPVLSFNTYNTVLHAWADPQADGDGYLGDYEFLILSTTADEIQLKGKKHAAYSVLRRLTEEVSAADYFAAVEAMDAQITGKGNLLLLKQNNSAYTLHNSAEGIFYLTEKNAVVNTEELDIYPFISTRTGIHAMVGFLDDYEDRECRDFVLENGVLKGKNATIDAGEMTDYVMNYMTLAEMKWTVDLEDINETAAQKIKSINTVLATFGNKKSALTGLTLSFDSRRNRYLVSVTYTLNGKSNESPVGFEYKVETPDSSVTMTYVGPVDDNGTTLIGVVTGLEDLLKLLEGSFALTNRGGINPALGITFTQNTNNDNWYKLSGTR